MGVGAGPVDAWSHLCGALRLDRAHRRRVASARASCACDDMRAQRCRIVGHHALAGRELSPAATHAPRTPSRVVLFMQLLTSRTLLPGAP
eukprot:3900334-Rhodomonas_salina.3